MCLVDSSSMSVQVRKARDEIPKLLPEHWICLLLQPAKAGDRVCQCMLHSITPWDLVGTGSSTKRGNIWD